MAGYADWNAFTTYNINDIVNYQGFLYVALQISLNRVPPANTTFWSSTTPSGGVASLNAQTGPVLLTSSTITITNPVPGTVNIESGALPTVVDSLNSQTGTVSLVSGGGTVVITNPTPGQINLESITDGVQSITAGTGISSTGGTTPTIANTGVLSVGAGSGISSTGGQNPTIANTGVLSVAVSSGLSSTGGQNPTLTNTGVLSLTAGNNIQISSPTGNIILAAKTPIPMSFSIGASTGFGIPGGSAAIGSFPLNTLTTFGNLLTGTGAFVGVNTGFIMIDLNAYSLSMVSGQPGNLQVYVSRVGDSIFSLPPSQTIAPSYPIASTGEVNFSIGYVILDLSQFRTAYGTDPNNANLKISILNLNNNTVYPAGNAENSIAWFYPDTIV